MYAKFGIFREDEVDLKAYKGTREQGRPQYKLKPLEIVFKISGEVFPRMTICKNANSHKFEAVNHEFETYQNYLKIDIFDFKDVLDNLNNFGDLQFWDIQQRYNYALGIVDGTIYQMFKYDLTRKIAENADVNIQLLRFDITLRVDNTDNIIRIKRWLAVNKRFFAGMPKEVLKIDLLYNELNSMVINEINNLMINDDKNAALLVDTLMEDWRSHHR